MTMLSVAIDIQRKKYNITFPVSKEISGLSFYIEERLYHIVITLDTKWGRGSSHITISSRKKSVLRLTQNQLTYAYRVNLWPFKYISLTTYSNKNFLKFIEFFLESPYLTAMFCDRLCMKIWILFNNFQKSR